MKSDHAIYWMRKGIMQNLKAMQTCTEGEDVTVTKVCSWCYKEASVTVRRVDFDDWQNGTLAQRAFPYLSHDKREILISGTHPECWTAMWSTDNMQAAMDAGEADELTEDISYKWEG